MMWLKDAAAVALVIVLAVVALYGAFRPDNSDPDGRYH